MPSVLSLKTYHPWLSTLDEQFQKYDAKSCTDPATLLLALVIYLASTSIPAQTHQLRSTLTSLIGSLRDSLLLHIPSSLAAIQALELLSLHAPLGALPWEQVHFHNLSVGRGQLSTALAIQQSLGSQAFSFRPDVDPFVHWEYREFWLWMSLVADQARVVLEDEVQELRTPPELADAKLLAERILASGSLHLWSDATSDSDCADLVGRLGVCHRIIRLSLVHETLKAYRSALEGLASDAFYNLVGDVTRLMNEFEVKQRTIEAQYDRIAGGSTVLSRLTHSYNFRISMVQTPLHLWPTRLPPSQLAIRILPRLHDGRPFSRHLWVPPWNPPIVGRPPDRSPVQRAPILRRRGRHQPE